MKTIAWENDKLQLLDQTRLPRERVYIDCADYPSVIAAIREMRVRGAPAIGVAGAYAVALGARRIALTRREAFLQALDRICAEVARARPTAVNLSWAVERVCRAAHQESTIAGIRSRALAEARRIQEEDERANRGLGLHGAALLPVQATVLTHCNAGALATAGYGTALGVVRAAREQGKQVRVFATETRPLLQGARLTAWELQEEGFDVTLITDSMTGYFLRRGEIDCIVVGADRVAANGDVANKIGTYAIAVLAKENTVPFYVAAPTSSIDLSTPSGDAIPIEERRPEEVTHVAGTAIAPEGVHARNPAFDVTPHRYVSAIITERGVVRAPFEAGLRRLLEQADHPLSTPPPSRGRGLSLPPRRGKARMGVL
ncbi:MAG: S-methyl-5-thioribose-1-phosphate isomerase [Chloroflexi bacterium]|nr:S-methyl-5-thioribose-1-phosphate isomerase [Chloroflexota bacterium]